MSKKSKLVAASMLSSTALTLAAPVFADSISSQTSSNTSAVQSSVVEKNKTAESQSASSSSDKSSNDAIQTLTEQTMIINKIIASSSDSSIENAKGANGAKFVVYDVTDLMNQVIKEELKSDEAIDKAIKDDVATATKAEASSSSTKKIDSAKWERTTESSTSSSSSSVASASSSSSTASSSSEVQSSESSTKTTSNDEESLISKIEDMRKNDTIRKEVLSRAEKLNASQLKKFAEVTTAKDNTLNKDGIARVKVPIDGKYHAYYVVNTDTAKESMATNSSPVVIITPVTNDNGEYSKDFTIYPKSTAITPTTTTRKMVQTGKQTSFWDSVVQFFSSLWK
ncbi:pilin N-terminal domain-containing protein [Lactobacillus jensenii]|uniref:pilin N-terminal domain-containing protein n=1 Tax=Lactobacillus jensenii TaxID=109790 RepID=UPI000C796844|nr:pilin N-terminal domain-containing protein [Lactobacillus jensenii]PLA44535.1 hypothetical protein CYJ90_04160 [Lactobacillus jensenii]